jgi:hypothetical protein
MESLHTASEQIASALSGPHLYSEEKRLLMTTPRVPLCHSPQNVKWNTTLLQLQSSDVGPIIQGQTFVQLKSKYSKNSANKNSMLHKLS